MTGDQNAHPMDAVLDAINAPSPAFQLDGIDMWSATALIDAHTRQDTAGFMTVLEGALARPDSLHRTVVSLAALAGALAARLAEEADAQQALVNDAARHLLVEAARNNPPWQQ